MDYYDVSCDYLLGRSAERSGQTITVEELPEGNSATGGSVYRGSVLPTMYKKLIENSLDILYDKLQESRDKQLVVGVSSYLMLAVYKMFRLLYEASPKNVSGMFQPRQKCRRSHARAEKGGVKPKIRACAVRLHRLFCIGGDITGRAGLTCPVPCGRRGRRICRGAARRREKCRRRKRSCPARGTCA